MLDQILSKLGLGGNVTVSEQTRRKFIRYPGQQAEVSLAGRVYGVRDWSVGGLLFEANADNSLVVGDHIMVDLKFRMPHETVTIRQKAKVVRAAKRGVAAQFIGNTDNTVRRLFDRVIDGYNTQSFLESQVA